VRCKSILGLVVQLALFIALCSALPVQDKVDVDDLVRRAIANHVQRELIRNDYTYLAHMRWTDSGYCGRSRPYCTESYEIMFLEGAPYTRHTAHNDQPLSADVEKLEEAMLQAEAKARRAGAGNKQGSTLGYMMESKSTWTLDHLTTEFSLRGKGTSVLNGRRVYVVEALPREKPGHLDSTVDYPLYFKTTIWIDIEEQQIVRAKEELIEDNLIITQPAIHLRYPLTPEARQIYESGKSHGTYARGAFFVIQWTKINGEAWLPQVTHSKFKVWIVHESPAGEMSRRVEFRRKIDTTYSDYQKFVVKTRIVP